jgi:hypothetical protein
VVGVYKPQTRRKGTEIGCQDKTKIGLKKNERKKITALGVKPIDKV